MKPDRSVFWRIVCGLVLSGLGLNAQAAAKRPNFVFLVSEDNSIHYMRLYGNPLAPTPQIEKLAAHGLVFDNAYSCGPVCSVARTTLATGMYAPRGGFQYHRKLMPAGLPRGFKMWSEILKDAGYYVANNVKTDYNVDVSLKQVWSDCSRKASWRNRPTPDTPFFYMQSFGVTHESSLHFSRQVMATQKTLTPPDKVQLAPYHPDTPTFRYTYARYHDRIRQMDQQIGTVVAQLEADGLLEDTFIFYFGDHGGVLPRSKGYAYDCGLHVPLIVRVPEHFKHLVQPPIGSRVHGFVEFTDFGPTLLHLAGVQVPASMDGRPLLGPDISVQALNERNEAFGYADRFDEKYDMVRALRQGRYVYIRNYHGYYPDALQNNYRYNMLAYQEWRELWRAGKLNPVQSQFFHRRPAEQLFDLQTDPHQVLNLAGDPDRAEILHMMRRRMTERIKQMNDLSFYPESYMIEKAIHDPVAFGHEHAAEIARLVDIADLALLPFDQAGPALRRALQSTNPWERYWALTTCAVIGQPARVLAPEARACLDDPQRMVRLRAAEFLGLIRDVDPRPTLLRILAETDSEAEALLTLNAVVLFRDFEPHYPIDTTQLKLKHTTPQIARRLEYLHDRAETP